MLPGVSLLAWESTISVLMLAYASADARAKRETVPESVMRRTRWHWRNYWRARPSEIVFCLQMAFRHASS